jgi:hypothetical protein
MGSAFLLHLDGKYCTVLYPPNSKKGPSDFGIVGVEKKKEKKSQEHHLRSVHGLSSISDSTSHSRHSFSATQAKVTVVFSITGYLGEVEPRLGVFG